MALHERFRTHTLTVQRVTRVSDGQGGWIETESSVGTVTGSLQAGGSSDATAADQGRAVVTWSLFVDPAPNVLRGDVLVFGAQRFRAVAVSEDDADSTIDNARVDLEEIQHGR